MGLACSLWYLQPLEGPDGCSAEGSRHVCAGTHDRKILVLMACVAFRAVFRVGVCFVKSLAARAGTRPMNDALGTLFYVLPHKLLCLSSQQTFRSLSHPRRLSACLASCATSAAVSTVPHLQDHVGGERPLAVVRFFSFPTHSSGEQCHPRIPVRR